MKTYFLVLYLLLCSYCWGQNLPLVTQSYLSRGTTSDGFVMERMGFSVKPLSDLNWPYQGEPAKGQGWGGDFLIGNNQDNFEQVDFFQLVLLKTFKRSRNLSFTPLSGFTHLKDVDENKRVAPYAGFKLDLQFSKLFINFSLIHKSQIDNFVGSARDLYWNQGLNNQLNLVYKPSANWFIRSRNTTGHWNDGANRFLTDNSLLYGVSMSDFWFLIGPVFSYMSYNKKSGQYWSPHYFRSYGLQAELSFPIISKLSFKSGGSLNIFREEDFEEGSGHYLRSGLFYGVREKYLFSFEVESTESKQRNNVWKSNNLIFNFQIPI